MHGTGRKPSDKASKRVRFCELDHLVITAPTLAAGTAWVESILGVTLQAGGEHQRMGTHNALLQLGNSAYLEVIAPNPLVPRPNQARWFELDRIEVDALPRLATWVARTGDIASTTARCRMQFGDIEPMSRGPLNWLITIPRQGALIAGGIIPMLIEWHVDKHPASGLEDKGCRLSGLELFHSEVDPVAETLGCLALRGEVVMHQLPAGEKPYLVAFIETPNGPRSIGSA
jgi:Glyoxalase-like domain